MVQRNTYEQQQRGNNGGDTQLPQEQPGLFLVEPNHRASEKFHLRHGLPNLGRCAIRFGRSLACRVSCSVTERDSHGSSRADVSDPLEISVLHCTNRCVWRCFLCGHDPASGKNYEHRKQWLENRLGELAGRFTARWLRIQRRFEALESA